MMLDPMHHGLMLLWVVGDAAIEVRSKLDSPFPGVIDGTESINEETESLVSFFFLPFADWFSQEGRIEFEELQKKCKILLLPLKRLISHHTLISGMDWETYIENEPRFFRNEIGQTTVAVDARHLRFSH